MPTIVIRDRQTGQEFEGPTGTAFDPSKYELVGSEGYEEKPPPGPGIPAGEGTAKPGFLQALGQSAKERLGELGQLPGDLLQTGKNVGTALSDPNLPLRLSAGTVSGPVGPVLSSALNVGTEGLAQYREGELKPWNLALAGGLPLGIEGLVRGTRAVPNFRTRVQPGRFRSAQEAAQADLETTLQGARAQAPRPPSDVPPPPTSLGEDVDMITRRLGNEAATERAYGAARAAIPGGSGTRVPMTNLQAAMKDLETHVIPLEPGPGTLQPLADEVARLRAASEGLRPTEQVATTSTRPSTILGPSGKPVTVTQAGQKSVPQPGTEGTMPIGDAIKELRELGIRLKNRSDELGNLSKGHLAFLWKSLHADVEAAARAGVPGAAEALEAAKAMKGQLGGESVERMVSGASKEGVVDPEKLSRALRQKQDPLERLTDPKTVQELERTAERHRIESGVREGANVELAKQRAAQAKVTESAEKRLGGAFKNPQTGGSPQVGGENLSTLDVGALETLLNRNAAEAEKAFGPGGIQMLRDFVAKNRALPPKYEGLGGVSSFQGLLATLAAVAAGGGGKGTTAAALAGLTAAPTARGIRSFGRAVQATPPPPPITTPRPFGQAPAGLERSQELWELLSRLSRGGTGALNTGLSNALRQ